jgi:hypothetical protein
MRYLPIAIFSLLVFYSCKKWVDPPPQNDPRLTSLYCNDPTAVNYNWGFPGKPDNSVCIYPTDRFVGSYLVHDSVYVASSGLFLSADSFIMNINKASLSKLIVSGFCANGNTLMLTAGRTLIATVDTTVGDTLSTNRGQIFCATQDTVTGTIVRDFLDASLLRINFQVVGDTGTTFHVGKAVKQ